MADPLATTFHVLTSTTNTHVVDVLIHAVESGGELLRERAVEALLHRHSTRGHVEIIRHWDLLSDANRAS